ncbi:MAG: hypothetical protein RTU30_05305 [Candidatus Thorarchaeota archaeon]
MTLLVAKYHISSSSANISFADGAAERVDYDEKDYDPYNAVTTGASWVFTAPHDGYYQAYAQVWLQSTATWALGEACYLTVFFNSVGKGRHYRNDINSGGTAIFTTMRITSTSFLYTGQTIYLSFYQNSGGALSLYTGGSDELYTYVDIFKI